VIISLIPTDAEVLIPAHITLTCIYAILRMLSCNSSTGLREIYGNILFLFYCLCGISVLVTTTWRVFTFRMEKLSADMESSRECIKYRVRTEVKWWSNSFVFGRIVNRFSLQMLQCYEILQIVLLWALLNAVMDIEIL